MYSEPMTYEDLREQADAAGMLPHEFVRGRKSAGTLVERRPHVEPGRSLRRRAHFQAVPVDQALPLEAPNPHMARCGRLRIGAEDVS